MLVQANYQVMNRQVNFRGALTKREETEFKHKISIMGTTALQSLQEKIDSKITSAVGDGFPGFVQKEKAQTRLISAELCTRMTDDGDYKEPKHVIYP